MLVTVRETVLALTMVTFETVLTDVAPPVVGSVIAQTAPAAMCWIVCTSWVALLKVSVPLQTLLEVPLVFSVQLTAIWKVPVP